MISGFSTITVECGNYDISPNSTSNDAKNWSPNLLSVADHLPVFVRKLILHFESKGRVSRYLKFAPIGHQKASPLSTASQRRRT